MCVQAVLNVDLADVWESPGRKNYIRTIAWGDEVTVVKENQNHVVINAMKFEHREDGSILPVPIKGYVEPSRRCPVAVKDLFIPKDQNQVMKVNFIDVQQGDGAVIESPDGKVILVDGGDNQLFARYLAGRFRGTSPADPKVIDCIVVTHGDADHFEGLLQIKESETNSEPRKQLFMKPLRVYHNGVVKGPSKRNGKSVPDKDLLGTTTESGGDVILTDLPADLLSVPDSAMNEPFRRWKRVLADYNKTSAIEFRRLSAGDDEAFAFFSDHPRGISIEVLGPIAYDSGGVHGLRFLRLPGTSSLSASHTINGHSLVFHLTYGGFSYLFTGDINEESSRSITDKCLGTDCLKSDVFKVPHHGSADYCCDFIKAVSPVVSVVSSGDDSLPSEYIHPRANLMAALGRYSRGPMPLVLVTELIAFFREEGWSEQVSKNKDALGRGRFFGFSITAFGSVKTRTDGKRLLVYTDSGNADMKEPYAYRVDSSGIPVSDPVCRV
jgi:beta-lactamase superfamily II metal-dependent hydrolase